MLLKEKRNEERQRHTVWEMIIFWAWRKCNVYKLIKASAGTLALHTPKKRREKEKEQKLELTVSIGNQYAIAH